MSVVRRLVGVPLAWKRADRPEPQQWFEGVRMPAGCREHHPALVTTRIVYREDNRLGVLA